MTRRVVVKVDNALSVLKPPAITQFASRTNPRFR
jgi:hypothetical protein